MRVAFNAQLLSYNRTYRSAGISRYIDRTLAHLPDYLDESDSIRVFVGPDVPRDESALSWARVARTRLPTHRPLARIVWEQLFLPVALRLSSVDLLHAPAYVAPIAVGCPTVVTI